MTKQIEIVATWIYQALPSLPYHKTIVISALSTNADNIKISESENPWSDEFFELVPWQAISLDWESSRNLIGFFISGTISEKYQIIVK